MALYEMSGYQHVTDGTRYPAVMVTTGFNVSWQPGKTAARLQAATSSGKPFCCAWTTMPATELGQPRHSGKKRLPMNGVSRYGNLA